jgi:hypothetical protein
MLTLKDLTLIRDRAISSLVKVPARCRLTGMTVDLTDQEKHILAFYESAVSTVFEKLGIDPTKEQLDALLSTVFTATQESVFGEDVSYNTT